MGKRVSALQHEELCDLRPEKAQLFLDVGHGSVFCFVLFFTASLEEGSVLYVQLNSSSPCTCGCKKAVFRCSGRVSHSIYSLLSRDLIILHVGAISRHSVT